MDLTAVLQALPKWAFGFLAAAIAVVLFYSLAFASCTVEIFGLGFGPKVACGAGSALTENFVISTQVYSRVTAGDHSQEFICPQPDAKVVSCDTFLGPSGSVVCGTSIDGRRCIHGGCNIVPDQKWHTTVVCAELSQPDAQ